MEIKGTALYEEMMRVRQEASGVSAVDNGVVQDFGMLFKSAINNVNALQQDTNQKRTAFDMGDRSVGLSDVMIAAQKSSIAFDATVEVRNKFVEAYKTIMNMSV